MKKHFKKIIAGVIVVSVLVFAFIYGGNAPEGQSLPSEIENEYTIISNDEVAKEDVPIIGNVIGDIFTREENEPATEENRPQKQDGTPMTPEEKVAMAEKIAKNNYVAFEDEIEDIQNVPEEINALTDDAYVVDAEGETEVIQAPVPVATPSVTPVVIPVDTPSVPVGKPVPVEPQDAEVTDKKLTCTLSVRCDTILDNIGWLEKEKVDIVPKDGIIYKEETVTFYEGESVFDLLHREMKRKKIHMEFENTPIYNSVYIEGIANLYEFDCGELSGWMYKVNGWFPNYGCSRYQLKDGDRVEWVYTCDLGVDVGGFYATSDN